MNNKSRILTFIFSSLLVISSFTLVNNKSIEVKASEELSISSSGDDFVLLDKSYTKEESFVYTADLHFKSGQAGGIAFGSENNDHYFVLNMDRYENRVKLMHFTSKNEGGYDVDELRSDYFIGNSKITEHELAIVNPSVKEKVENVNLKVILTIEDEHAYVECFVEGIKRFGIDSIIDLNDLGKSYQYEGGNLGMNCFNSDVYLENIEIGKSDYSYFSEPYRNQYHLQPFAKWTNDPNALCYYNGYYHVFYQTHPFGLYWGDMYWGHARSKDLIHFEFLPICLFPETEAMGFGPGNGFMWSGCAITYQKGMINDIDALNWFPNGGGNGIIAIYTREGGLQDQVIISSDDEGLTWTKRKRIPQNISGYDYHVDFRDPKVFPLVKDGEGKVTLWGMSLSSMNLSKGWFLKSSNLLDWSLAGSFNFPRPECIGIGVLKDELNVEHAYLTNKSRTYILGSLSYDELSGNIVFKDEEGIDISTYSLEQIENKLKLLDYGPDTYASQSFYISDPSSEFYGKDIVLNWFSGDLNASFCTGPGEYANLRKRWNGGFTIPVEYGISKVNDEYLISQKPITVNNTNLLKDEVVNINDVNLNENSENPLKDVHTHIFELDASIKVNNNSPITFKVDVGDDEYMQFGWNNIDGYYVDRTYLDDKGINTNIDWHTKYSSHILGNSDVKTFYVLSDNGGLEVFCEDFAVSFYFVTTASIFSTGASLKADDALINHLTLNNVKSIYRDDASLDEGVLYVSSNEVNLDKEFSNSKFVTCWYSGLEDLSWELISGEDVVDYIFSNQGINLVAKNQGEAVFKVSAGGHEEYINVYVHDSSFTSDLSFDKENVVSGQWVMQEESLFGSKSSGNAFLLANEVGSDFTFTSQFDILEGVAASIVFRASSDMSSYIVANYDVNEKVVKLWSTHGELARSSIIEVDQHNITLTVKAEEKDIQITINGINAISYTLKDDEPLSGKFGVNVFSGSASFKAFSLVKENYEYESGELQISLAVPQFVYAVYNVTLGNIRLEPGFYYQTEGVLIIKEEYLSLLENNKRYQFRVVGDALTFTFNVDVNYVEQEMIFEDITIEEGYDAYIYIGNLNVTSITVNGEELNEESYYVKDYVLHINKECLKEGDNDVSINGNEFVITVKNVQEEIIDIVVTSNNNINLPLIIILSIAGTLLLIGGAVLVIILIKKRKVN